MMTSNDVIRVFHEKTDMRHMVIPGARMVMIVVMKFTAPMMVPKPERPRPNTHMFEPTPGLNVVDDSGV